MLPKQFLVDDVGREIAALHARCNDLHKRTLLLQRQIESQKRTIEALRKRVSRQAEKLKPRGSASSAAARRWEPCTPTLAPSAHQ